MSFTSALQQVSNQLTSVLATGKLQTNTDAYIIASSKRSEISELRAQLTSQSKEKKKTALKKVIASMTLGKDVSSLFTEVVNCIQTTNVELKKLVYLYLINFARIRPDLAVLAINTFRKDCQDQNPIVRALAIRTLGCIKLHTCVEYVIDPLQKLCQDPDPYVRKCAVISVGKVYDTNPQMCLDNGLVHMLKNMLQQETSHLVIVNILATLQEIAQPGDPLVLDTRTVQRLISSLSECGEWGQVIVLDAISTCYNPPTNQTREIMIDKLTSRLTHNNAAVVLAAVRLIIKLILELDNNEVMLQNTLEKRIVPALTSLLASETPEIAYSILRNIRIIQTKFPQNSFANDFRAFYVKFNDPPYIKYEKLEMMTACAIANTDPKAVQHIINELIEYSLEADLDFVRRSVRALGRAALLLPSHCNSIVVALMNALDMAAVVDEVVVVMSDILRRFPGHHTAAVPAIVAAAEHVDCDSAKQATIWILGEFCESVPECLPALEAHIQSCASESEEVQIQLLRATAAVAVKLRKRALFNNCVTELSDGGKIGIRAGGAAVRSAYKNASQNAPQSAYKVGCKSVVLLERVAFYTQLLDGDQTFAKEVICRPKPPISTEFLHMPSELVDCLIANIGNTASVLHDYPETFVAKIRDKDAMRGATVLEDSDDDENREVISGRGSVRRHDTGERPETGEARGSDTGGSLPNYLDGPEHNIRADTHSGRDLLEGVPGDEPQVLYGDGQYTIRGNVARLSADDRRVNLCVAPAEGAGTDEGAPSPSWSVTIDKNSFGLQVAQGAVVAADSRTHSLRLEELDNYSGEPPIPPLTLTAHIGNLCSVPIPYSVLHLLTDRRAVPKDTYKKHWTRMGETRQLSFFASNAGNTPVDVQKAIASLDQAFLRLVTKSEAPTHSTLYLSAVTINKLLILCEYSFQSDAPGILISMRADAPMVAQLVADDLCALMNWVKKV
ncbi:putative beta adaptin [Gregarina niphandrodes]|uniref:Beta adaptin n=1 Tax=Gregarina niphandrodes TaxID=110365 RepID=A0A023B865_GRENI|nr:putative beta adaptin [Gregarina niphandrodes]EZG68466.1 putative beta adaptin [Gregarina niphandrodes]|eukprot:XP_011134571.1 putative beta adaptin [Gregarina niphandrodes]